MIKTLFPLPYFLSSFYVVVKLGNLATTILFQPTLSLKVHLSSGVFNVGNTAQMLSSNNTYCEHKGNFLEILNM
jgi:hypothetical protein